MCATPAAWAGLELPEEATDRGLEPSERRLSLEVLVELVGVVAALDDGAGVWR
jgi:hypothetical protein